jgi:hypothetical protein
VAELRFAEAPPREELLRSLRPRLDDAAPGLRVLAQDVLGCEAPIDFVGVGPTGGVALVLVGAAGEDLELVACGLAQRAWLAPRLRDWLQLAPDLGLRPEAGVAIVLLCPDFGPASRAAADALGEAAPRLVRYCCVRNGSGVEVLVERRLEGTQAPLRHGAGARPAPPPPRAPEPGPLRSRFRTGLTDADLGFGGADAADPGPGLGDPGGQRR